MSEGYEVPTELPGSTGSSKQTKNKTLGWYSMYNIATEAPLTQYMIAIIHVLYRCTTHRTKQDEQLRYIGTYDVLAYLEIFSLRPIARAADEEERNVPVFGISPAEELRCGYDTTSCVRDGD